MDHLPSAVALVVFGLAFSYLAIFPSTVLVTTHGKVTGSRYVPMPLTVPVSSADKYASGNEYSDAKGGRYFEIHKSKIPAVAMIYVTIEGCATCQVPLRMIL
jgi:hypothetical protein